MVSVADIPDRSPSRMGFSRPPLTRSGPSMDVSWRASSSSQADRYDDSSSDDDDESTQSFLPPMLTTRGVQSDDEDDDDYELYGTTSPPAIPRLEFCVLPDATSPPPTLWSIEESFDEDGDVWSVEDEPAISSAATYIPRVGSSHIKLSTVVEEDDHSQNISSTPPPTPLLLNIIQPIPMIADEAFFSPALPADHGRSRAAHDQVKRFWNHRHDIWLREERARVKEAYGGIANSPPLESLGGFATTRLPHDIPETQSTLFASSQVSPTTHPGLFPRIGALAPSNTFAPGQDPSVADRTLWALPVPSVRKLMYINEMLAIQARGRVSPTGSDASDASDETLVDDLEVESKTIFAKSFQGGYYDGIEHEITMAMAAIAIC